MNVLHAASECVPLAKTGGLADVLGALPGAQAALGVDVRVVIPAYRGTIARLAGAREVGALLVRGQRFGIVEGTNAGATTWLLDCPGLYDRAGDPYHDANAQPHGDNAWRFGCFGEAVARLARGEGTGWRADILHGHDWQAGSALALASDAGDAARRVFTIHNLAYAGVFGRVDFDALGWPSHWWDPRHGEFYGAFSFLKAGLVTAHAITTVSPRYAEEIRTPAFGCGLDGVLRERADRLTGILNGIDVATWDPRTDARLARRYGPRDVTAGKRANAQALRARLGLVDDGAFL
ncbi:MAG TPA: glycogen/starch synthase, partial [Nevskiaceae bacterium]|nr:glycogen/starch synthase [Nevskiaceae bacterium]